MRTAILFGSLLIARSISGRTPADAMGDGFALVYLVLMFLALLIDTYEIGRLRK